MCAFLICNDGLPFHDATALHSTLTTEVTPSFILLAIQGVKVVTYVYELHGDQVDVSKSEFSKAP